MKKVLIAVVFLLVLFLVAVELEKRYRKEVLPEESRLDAYFKDILNVPTEIDFLGSVEFYGGDDEGPFVNGVVSEINGRTVTLELLNETIFVEVRETATYRIYEPGFKVKLLEGDHFNDIKPRRYITFLLRQVSDNLYYTEGVLLYPETR